MTARTMLLAAVCAAAARGQVEVPQDARLLAPTGARVPHGVAVAWRADALQVLTASHELVLRDFPLTATRTIDLALQRTEVLAPDARLLVGHRAATAPPALAVFRGVVDGVPESRAYLAVSPWATNGFVHLDGREYVVSSGPYGAGMPVLVFDPAKVGPQMLSWAPFACRTEELGGPRAPTAASAALRGQPPCRRFDVAIDCDSQFVGLFGGDTAAAAAYAATLVGGINEIYGRDFNLTLNVSFLRLWPADPNDPWTRRSTPAQLFQFRDYWVENHADVPKTSAHLFSGRSLGGGIAWLEGVCVDDFEYAVSADLSGFFPYPIQDFHPQNYDLFVIAHEWGHVYGAPHTHEQNPLVDTCGIDCNAPAGGTIMSYCAICDGGFLNVRMGFAAQTINAYVLPHLDDPAVGALCGDLTCPAGGPGDLDADGDVDLDDLLILLNDFGCAGGCAADIDGDFDTDFDDLLILLLAFG